MEGHCGAVGFAWLEDGTMLMTRWTALGRDCAGPAKLLVETGTTSTCNVLSGLHLQLLPLPKLLQNHPPQLHPPLSREVGTHGEQLPTKPASHPRQCQQMWEECTCLRKVSQGVSQILRQ